MIGWNLLTYLFNQWLSDSVTFSVCWFQRLNSNNTKNRPKKKTRINMNLCVCMIENLSCFYNLKCEQYNVFVCVWIFCFTHAFVYIFRIIARSSSVMHWIQLIRVIEHRQAHNTLVVNILNIHNSISKNITISYHISSRQTSNRKQKPIIQFNEWENL